MDAHAIEDLVDLLGDARLVLLGEASHGTHEFYDVRAEVTRRLVAERGFRGDDATAADALGDFTRFPTWMWRNPVVVDLAEWLREHGGGAGFYGLDLYSLRESMDAVVGYLEQVDPEAARRARARYACFDHRDEQAYGHKVLRGEQEPCEDAVVAQLTELRDRVAELAAHDGRLPRDARFVAEENARLAADAERYYRAIFHGRVSAWNLRDTHMADTLDALIGHVGGAGVVVWAHNSHLGDARATSMGREHGELSLGQLVRERHGPDAVRIVGFTTHHGTVTAARDWGGAAERRVVPPSLEGSVERLLHDAGVERGVLAARAVAPAREVLQRMIGVIYRPETERWSHYVEVDVGAQLDLLVHLDRTTALEPLDRWPGGEEEPADTFPSGW